MNKLFVFGLLLMVGQKVVSSSNFYSHETKSNSVDDGQNIITEIEESEFDSMSSKGPKIKHYLRVAPRRSANSMISKQQVITNKISTGLENETLDSQSLQQFLKRFSEFGSGFRRGFNTKARAVESPAVSVDSGGRSTNNLASGVAKLFHVKQGHYSDIYDRIDRSTASTRYPAYEIEDSIRNRIYHLFSDRHRDRRVSSKNYH